MRSEKKITMEAGHFANGARLDKPADTADLCQISPVLHDGMNPACVARTANEIARFFQCFCHRFFGKNMAAGFQRGSNCCMPGGWYHNIENDVRRGLSKDIGQITADSRSLPTELPGACSARPVSRSTMPTISTSPMVRAASNHALLMAPQPTKTARCIFSPPNENQKNQRNRLQMASVNVYDFISKPYHCQSLISVFYEGDPQSERVKEKKV